MQEKGQYAPVSVGRTGRAEMCSAYQKCYGNVKEKGLCVCWEVTAAAQRSKKTTPGTWIDVLSFSGRKLKEKSVKRCHRHWVNLSKRGMSFSYRMQGPGCSPLLPQGTPVLKHFSQKY